MRIGILTHFHKSTNYGGVLQAYALCKCLNDRGHSAEQILYKHSVTKIDSARMTGKTFFEKTKKRIKKIIYRRKNREIRRRMEMSFSDFRESVPHTCREYTSDTIEQVVSDFDLYITGSDQVWNPIWHDPAYLLQFVGNSAPKISYAASLGVSVLDQQQEKIFRTYLTDFDGISVREKTAADLLSPLTNKEVNVCVDPTLLLSVDDWDAVASERVVDEKYVFLYLLGDDMRVRKLAESFADFHGMKLVMIPDLLGAYRKNDRKICADFIPNATPRDFISLIKHSEYVLTDSFHTCVFSLLYKKEFFAFSRGGLIKMGSRIGDLLTMFECSSRFCVGGDRCNLDYLLSCKPIDYKKEFHSFNKEKQESLDYLLNYLN